MRRRRGLVGTAARTAVVVGTATAVSGSVNKKQQAKADQTQKEATINQPLASDADTQIIEIQKFSALKDQGVITEEEFAAKKRQILGL